MYLFYVWKIKNVSNWFHHYPQRQLQGAFTCPVLMQFSFIKRNGVTMAHVRVPLRFTSFSRNSDVILIIVWLILTRRTKSHDDPCVCSRYWIVEFPAEFNLDLGLIQLTEEFRELASQLGYEEHINLLDISSMWVFYVLFFLCVNMMHFCSALCTWWSHIG